MKKQSTLIFALIIWCSTSISQTPAITMTSSMSVGSTFYFHLRGTNPMVQIDFGDGTLVNRTIDTTSTNSTIFEWNSNDIISDKLKSSKTVKIYGSGITTLACYEDIDILHSSPVTDSLTSLDVSNCSTLKSLDCSGSQLTTLDLSKNTILNNLACSSNQLPNLNVSYQVSLKRLECSRNKLATLDVSKNTLLGELRCSSNNLTTLDVSKNTALGWLDCPFNNLTTLDVSKNNVLGWLICSANNLITLDVSNNTFLGRLSCSYNKLTILDVSSNSGLRELICGYNPLSSLDLSKNKALVELNCSGIPLTSLDVSKNTDLMELYCSDNQLTNLDVSQNNNLMYFYCDSNQLTSLDISHNTNLWMLFCNNNKLTSLDVSKNTQLVLNLCHNNQFTFATLPIPIPTTYAPQSPILIEKALGTGEEVDLSSQLTISGNTTVYTWKTKSGATLVQGADYSLTNGKTVFLKSQADSVYCEMTNATFPLFTGDDVLKTTFAKVSINTGIDNVNSPAVQIYALNKTLYIVASYNGQASVYDINGRLAMAKEISTGTNTIALPKGGVYVVRLTGSNTAVIKKVFAGN